MHWCTPTAQTDRRQTGRQAGREAGGQAGRQGGRQAGRQADKCTMTRTYTSRTLANKLNML